MKSGIILLALLIAVIACATLSGAKADNARANVQSNPLINFQETINLAGSLKGSGSSNSGSSSALALASGDFDEDGTDDLLAAYSTGEGGEINVYLADQDAIFQSETLSLVLTEAPELIATGDFDADGNMDIVAAQRAGNTLHLFRGNGKGSFAESEAVSLPGRVVAMKAGEVNRRDGLGDLVVSIASDEGAQLLVFESPEGALRAKPEILSLPAEAGSIALAHLDNDYNVDIALSIGAEVVLVHGRDRKLTRAEYARTDVPPAKMERLNVGASISSLVTGDFTGDSRAEIALVTDEGTVRFLERADAREEQQQASAGTAQISKARKETREKREASWGLSSSSLSAPGRGNNFSFIAAKVSALAKTDLLIADSRLHIFNHATEDANSLASYDMAGEVVAVLPMRLNQDALSDLVILNQNSLAPSLLITAPNATFTVNSAADTDDGACNANCTLREAINAANNSPGADTIQFGIGAGTPTINVGSTGLGGLPRITEAVTINGNTGGATRIELNGTQANTAGLSQTGIYPDGSNITVRGLVINRFGFYGMEISGNNNIVANCLIGTDPTGTLDRGNVQHGIGLYGGTNNRIGGTTAADKNVISGNGRAGLWVTGSFSDPATGDLIGRNFIGVNITGDAAIPNGEGGIFVEVIFSSDVADNQFGVGPGGFNVISGNTGSGIKLGGEFNLVQFNLIGTNLIGDQRVPNSTDGIYCYRNDNTIGGPTDTAINLISGNISNGIHIINGSRNRVQGCKIGTNADGDAVLFNSGSGIAIDGTVHAEDNEIGGITSQLRNIISGNTGAGIRLGQDAAHDNKIFGNYIGTDVTGATAIPNSNHGVFFDTGAAFNILGGLTVAERNVIAGNFESGVRFFSNSTFDSVRWNKVIGNYIGVNASGAALGNSTHGVFMSENVANAVFRNSIGGVETGAGNVIANNGGDGIFITGGHENGIFANSIHSNTGLGIDLGANGVTANDIGDQDTGGNDLQNFPVISSAIRSGSNTIITGTMSSFANNSYTIEFFSNPACDASGNGEAQTFLGSTTVTTDVNGNAPINVVLPVAVTAGHFITATATDVNDNTSELSACQQVIACSFSINPTSRSHTSKAETGSVTVTGTAGCAWTATESLSWVTITSGASGTGNGTVNYSVDANSTTSARSGSITIAGQTFTVNQSAASVFTFSAATYSVNEAGPTITITVNRTNTSNGTMTVNYATSNGTATAPADYTAASGTLTFTNTDATETFNITIANDTLTEDNEAVNIALSSPSAGAAIGTPGTATLTIVDNDTIVTSAADSGDGSLRQAITNANAIAGTNTISFNITPAGAKAINLASPLPTITEQVTIDGTTQPGFASAPIIELNGTSAGANADGLTITTDSCVIKSLIINRFEDDGIILSSADNNTITGCYIGANAAGTADAGNTGNGVTITDSANNRIGGPNAADRNVISGNGSTTVLSHGIQISGSLSTGNRVQRNLIGIGANGTAQIGNAGHGIFVGPNASSNILGRNSCPGGCGDGSDALDTGNTIAYNGSRGIYMTGGPRNGVLTNSIHSNVSLGLDLTPSGVSANNDDTTAAEQARPNHGRNFPVIVSAASSGPNIIITGTLDSLPSTGFLLEFFDNDICDTTPAGDNSHGEGKTYIGSTTVTTNASGDATFAVTLPVSVAVGHFITATSTNDLNTSEFSRSVAVCAYALTAAPESQLFPARGGSGEVRVTASGGCGWTASSGVSWIIITSATSGTGTEMITYEVRENTAASARTGTMTIAGLTFTVLQDRAGGTCTYSVSPISQTFAGSGGTGNLTVTATAGCAWNAKADVSWITITSASGGIGNGSLTYSVASNPGPTGRNGTIFIEGIRVNVKQGR